MKFLFASCAALALALSSPALAQNLPMGVTIVGGPYILALNINAAGATTPVSVFKNPNYILDCTASNWNGATAQIQGLFSDGVTWGNGGVSALSANGSLSVSVGVESVRILVTGTPTGLTCGLR